MVLLVLQDHQEPLVPQGHEEILEHLDHLGPSEVQEQLVSRETRACLVAQVPKEQLDSLGLLEPKELKELRDCRVTEEAMALQETLVRPVHQDSREMLVHRDR